MKEIRGRGPGAKEEWMQRDDLRRGSPGRGPPGREKFRKQEREIGEKPHEEALQDDPAKGLAMRFAKGEITEEEDKKKLAVLKELKP